VSPDGGGDGLECGAQVADLAGEARGGACLGLVGAVFINDSAQALVAVEGSFGELGSGGDGGEGGLTGVEQFGAGLFNLPKGVVAHPVWACAMSVSRRATSLRYRSASAPQPRAVASAASASASTRWAASTPRWLTSVWKLGQCSQLLA